MFNAHTQTHTHHLIYLCEKMSECHFCPTEINCVRKWNYLVVVVGFFLRGWFVLGHWTAFSLHNHLHIIHFSISSDNFNWMSCIKTDSDYFLFELYFPVSTDTLQIDTWFVLFASVQLHWIYARHSHFFPCLHRIVFYIFQAVLILVIIPRFSAYCFFSLSSPLPLLFFYTLCWHERIFIHRTHITTDWNARELTTTTTENWLWLRNVRLLMCTFLLHLRV